MSTETEQIKQENTPINPVNTEELFLLGDVLLILQLDSSIKPPLDAPAKIKKAASLLEPSIPIGHTRTETPDQHHYYMASSEIISREIGETEQAHRQRVVDAMTGVVNALRSISNDSEIDASDLEIVTHVVTEAEKLSGIGYYFKGGVKPPTAVDYS
jgi:hypothetical protein